MELEQVWSLHVPEEHENTVRSREVPPTMKVHEDIIPLGSSSRYDLVDGVTICFFKNFNEIDYCSSEHSRDVTIPILPISSTEGKTLIHKLNSNHGPFKHLMLIHCAIDNDPKNIGIGIAGWKW